LISAVKARPVADKPPYQRIPLSNLPTTKQNISVISLFAGCGGSSLGYRYAGASVVWANEMVEEARKVYVENSAPYTVVDHRDIRTIDPVEVKKLVGEVDIIDGSPPCSSFSTAGKRHKLWGKEKNYSTNTRQRTDDLFWDYIRFVKALQPKVFVAENVKGLITGSSQGFYKEIFAEMVASGYKVKSAVLDGAWLGVPQLRSRLIFIGVRSDLSNIKAVFPKPLKYTYTVREVLPHIVSVMRGSRAHNWRSSDFPSPAIAVSDRNSSINSYFSGGGFVQTKDMEQRKYTIDELRVICGFPDDFKLSGNYEQQFERLARAVPPPMMRSIAEPMIEQLK